MMNIFTKYILPIIKGAMASFVIFPVVMGNAVAFTVITCIRIQLDWEIEKAYFFTLEALHLVFAFGAVAGLMLLTWEKIRFKEQNKFIFRGINVIDIGIDLVTFLTLWQWGRDMTRMELTGYATVSELAMVRVYVGIAVSFLFFIYFAGRASSHTDIPKAFFMTHKAFFTALIYGGIMMVGISGVAGAVEGLLYHNMSEKVYMHIASLSGFFAFMIFVGYFPDFRNRDLDEKREKVQKPSRFIEILFNYIMIPIFGALTIVLLLWAFRVLRMGPTGGTFASLASIAASYTLGGIWIHSMVTHYETHIAKIYRKVYPFTGLIILLFELWALIVQVKYHGVMTTEYIFMLLWIFAMVSLPFLFLQREYSHRILIYAGAALLIISIIPIVGYYVVPVKWQAARLEDMLVRMNMLQNGQITQTKEELTKEERSGITEAVMFLSQTDSVQYLPEWFDQKLERSNAFEETFGFEPYVTSAFAEGGNRVMQLYSGSELLDISEYQWVVSFRNMMYAVDSQDTSPEIDFEIEGEQYTVFWKTEESDTVLPVMTIEKNGTVILKQDFKEYTDQLVEQDSWNEGENSQDMTIQMETDELKLLLMLENVEIYQEGAAQELHYWIYPDTLYIGKK